MISRFIIDEKNRPIWFNYPTKFLKLVANHEVDFEPWHFMEAEEALVSHDRLKKLYDRELFPIANRQDNDDVACVEKDRGDEIFVIHVFASRGNENEEHYENFNLWFSSVLEENAEW